MTSFLFFQDLNQLTFYFVASSNFELYEKRDEKRLLEMKKSDEELAVSFGFETIKSVYNFIFIFNFFIINKIK